MVDKHLVDLADRYSRRRAWVAILAALAFLAVQGLAPPGVFGDGTSGTRVDWWVVNAIALLAVLATGGGLLNPRGVRALVHDELSRRHLRTAVVTGYWVIMGLGFFLYLIPWFDGFSAKQAVYVMVTGSVVVSLLTFAWLERRAHTDG